MEKICETKHVKQITDTLETTLGIIKSDGMKNRLKILRKIIRSGFMILYNKKVQLSPEQAADFLKYREQDKNFSILVYNLSNGPIEVMILTKDDAVNDFQVLLGPEKPSQARVFCPGSLRAEFGDPCDDFRNAVHGSCDISDARREIHFFHPNFIFEPSKRVKKESVCCYRDIIEPLMEGLQKFTKQRPTEPYTWLSQWFSENNRNFPTITEAIHTKPCQEKDTNEIDKSSSPCSSIFRDNSVSSILNSIMTSSSMTTSESIVCTKKEERQSTSDSKLDNVCDADNDHPQFDPFICPGCKKFTKIPVPNLRPKRKKPWIIERPSQTETTLSTGSSTTPICTCKQPSSTSSSSVIKDLDYENV